MTNMWAGKGMTVTFQSPPLNTILLLPPCLRELQNRFNIHVHNTYTTVEITEEYYSSILLKQKHHKLQWSTMGAIGCHSPATSPIVIIRYQFILLYFTFYFLYLLTLHTFNILDILYTSFYCHEPHSQWIFVIIRSTSSSNCKLCHTINLMSGKNN